MTKELQKIIAQAVNDAYGIELAPEISPTEGVFGDFATNVSFQLARSLRQPPKAIADDLVIHIAHKTISRVESAGAGYINIIMSQEYWINQLARVNEGFGRSPEGNGQKVQVEFISANPTGPTTFGNARGGFIGDVIARVLEFQGYDVTREYYFNDGGTQIRKLVESVKVAAGLVQAEEVQYRGDYVDELANEFGSKLKATSESEAAELLTQTILKRYIEPAVAKMHIRFDEWFNERSLEESGMVAESLAKLAKLELTYEQDGALWLANTKLGDERDRVLRKSNGDLTYLANDIAYHLNIFTKRNFDVAIKQWGADHSGQVPSLKLIMHKLVPDKRLEFNIHQWVRLIRGGQEVKMSKRAGNYVTVEEVIDELGEQGSDVTRFFMLMRTADSQMDFDLDLAKEQSQKNPMFYVMYSYVRANAILTKAKEQGLAIGVSMSSLGSVQTELIKQISQFPQLLEQIALDFHVHRLTFFGQEVAKRFHDYYETSHILNLPPAEASEQLYLVSQYVIFMKVYFSVLGITALAQM